MKKIFGVLALCLAMSACTNTDNDIVLFPVGMAHQLNRADDGNLALTASASEDDADLLLHLFPSVTLLYNYPAGRFQTGPCLLLR